jgi:outer membrane protein insertion porin family
MFETHSRMSIMLLIFLLFPPLLSFSQDNTESKIIKDIVIQGCRTIDKSTIFYNIRSKVGETISMDKIDRDLKALYALGFFENIDFKIEPAENGVILSIIITEKPVIEEIRIEGSNELNIDKIKKEITIKSGEIIDNSKITADVIKIKNLYLDKGFYFAQVESLVEPVSDFAVAVIYKIKENNKVKIKDINIVGNKGLSDFQVKKWMQTNESFWNGFILCILKIFKKCGKFNEDTLDLDMDTIRELYKDHGYVDIQVGKPKIDFLKNKKGEIKSIKIDIPVSEGELYKFGKISVSGNKIFYTDQIKKQFENLQIPGKTVYKIFGTNKKNLASGETYSITTVKLAALSIIELYSNNGYINAYPYPKETTNREDKTIDINFDIMEGNKFYLNKMYFTGNVHTRDKVIRREFLLDEGNVFNVGLMNSGKARLDSLQFFKEVKPTYEPIPGTDYVDLNVDVKDEGQTTLQFGVSYGGYDKFGGSMTLQQNNFMGLGYSTSIQSYITNRRMQTDLSFTDYWFLDKPLIFSVRTYITSEEFYTYDEQQIGGRLTFGKRFTQNISLSQSYKLENTKIDLAEEDIRVIDREALTSKDNNYTARHLPLEPTLTLNVDPESITSSTTSTFVFDNRDRKLNNPTKGVLNRSSFEIAGGPLLGDNYFYKLESELDIYIPLGEKLVLANKGLIYYADGYSGRDIPIFEKYYIGGPYSLRGFETKSVGPKDIDNNPIGGNKELFFSSELVISLNDPLKVVFFYDAGDVFASDENYDIQDLRTSYGAELRIFIPIFPYPLRLIYAEPIKPIETDRTNHFEFSIGLGFR